MAYEYVLLVNRPYSNNRSDPASGAAEEIRKVKLITEERLSPMFYGLTPTETDETKNGVKVLICREQAEAPADDSAALQVFAKSDEAEEDPVTELFFKDTAGNVYQWTKGGKLNAVNLTGDEEIEGEKTFKEPPDTTVKSGTATAKVADKLTDTEQEFDEDDVGRRVNNLTDGTSALITALVTENQVTLDDDIIESGDIYALTEEPTVTTQVVNKGYVDRQSAGALPETAVLSSQTKTTSGSLSGTNSRSRKIMVVATTTATSAALDLTGAVGATTKAKASITAAGKSAAITFVVPPGSAWTVTQSHLGSMLVETWEI